LYVAFGAAPLSEITALTVASLPGLLKTTKPNVWAVGTTAQRGGL
jgi:hypothetical protein